MYKNFSDFCCTLLFLHSPEAQNFRRGHSHAKSAPANRSRSWKRPVIFSVAVRRLLCPSWRRF